MNNVIVAISGKKQAGKNTIAEAISSYVKNVAPELENDARIISFADNLKEFCINTLGLSHDQCYGSDEHKNSFTDYHWENVSSVFRAKFASNKLKNLSLNELVFACSEYIPTGEEESNKYGVNREGDSLFMKKGKMTAREIMQLLGTELIRYNFGNIWAKATIRKIVNNNWKFTIVADNRFPDETESVLNQRYGYVIRLTRNPFDDKHFSETALDNYNWNQHKCFLIDNHSMSIEQQSKQAIDIVNSILREQQWA